MRLVLPALRRHPVWATLDLDCTEDGCRDKFGGFVVTLHRSRARRRADGAVGRRPMRMSPRSSRRCRRRRHPGVRAGRNGGSADGIGASRPRRRRPRSGTCRHPGSTSRAGSESSRWRRWLDCAGTLCGTATMTSVIVGGGPATTAAWNLRAQRLRERELVRLHLGPDANGRQAVDLHDVGHLEQHRGDRRLRHHRELRAGQRQCHRRRGHRHLSEHRNLGEPKRRVHLHAHLHHRDPRDDQRAGRVRPGRAHGCHGARRCAPAAV